MGAALGLGMAGVLTLMLHRVPSDDPSGVPADYGRGGSLAWAPGERPAPAFTLRDQDGRDVALSSLQGRPVVLAFLDSRCTDTCPIEGRQISDLSMKLPAGRRPIVVAVSVNPSDTPSSARAAAREWGWKHLRWHWLMGTGAQLRSVWTDYGIFVKPDAEDEQVQHTGALYLIDASGDVRAAYTVPIATPRLLGDIETLEGSAS